MGLKQIVNRSSNTIIVTLFLRYGDDPQKDAGAKSFTIAPGKMESISHSRLDIKANGIAITASSQDVAQYCEHKILRTGSELDELLNSNEVIAVSIPDRIKFDCLELTALVVE